MCGCPGLLPGSETGNTQQATLQETTPSATREVPGIPAVFITSPPFDGGVLSGNVTITVQVTHFVLGGGGGTNRSGSGRLIYYRDVVPPVVQGQPALTVPGSYAISSSDVYTWSGVQPGTHTFSVQLVNPDDSPLDPPAIDAIDVTAVSPGDIVVP